MDVLVIGAHGAVGQQLLPRLADAGHRVRAMVRSEDQVGDVARPGVTPVVADLEEGFDEAVDGCDALVFTAGSGADTGAGKTVAVDGLGAIRAVDHAERHGVEHFVMVSAMGADDPDRSEELRPYLVAKAIADGVLEASSVPHTIVRPGLLTDDPGSGEVRVGRGLDAAEIARADVAATLHAVLERPAMRGTTVEIVAGDVPVGTALDRFTSS